MNLLFHRVIYFYRPQCRVFYVTVIFLNSVHDIVSRFVLRLYRVYFLLKMPRRLSTEELRRLLEESDCEFNNDDTDSNGSNGDVEDESDPDISDQEPTIFADDDVDDPDFDPGEISRSNIVTEAYYGDYGRDSQADDSSDIVINPPRPETQTRARKRTAGEVMRLIPQEINDIDRENGWSQEILPLSRQPYNNSPTLHIQGEQSVLSIYRRILTDEILDLMVFQTNLYATQLKQNANMSVHSRMNRWTDITREELLKFIALNMLMGIVKYPTYESYWKLDPIYYHPIFHNVQSIGVTLAFSITLTHFYNFWFKFFSYNLNAS